MSKKDRVQDFIPIKDIVNGVVRTDDGRYIKILEIEPINFMLRSEEEQCGIIASFAGWLKISPLRLQFKSITKRADSAKYIAALKKELDAEPNEACRELGSDYIRLISEVGNREALTRRFFLIFTYENAGGIAEDSGRIYGELMAAEQNARAYLALCGNSVVQPKDEDEAAAEILYTFFNRNSSAEETFPAHVERVVVETMLRQERTIGIDPTPYIPLADFISPKSIDLSRSNCIVMDGTYYTYLYIRGNGYPSRIRGGWLSSIVNAGEGIDVDVFLSRENRSRAVDKVAQRIRLNKTKLKDKQDTSTDFEELANSVQSGYYIKQGLANGDDLFYLSVFITVSARSMKELTWRKQQISLMLRSADVYVSECRFRQEAALKTSFPLLCPDAKLLQKAKRNVLTGGAAASYMFTSFEMSDDGGVLLGINQHNRSLCIVDLFNTKKNKNANMNLLGTSGAGKTFTMQLLALRMRMRGIQCFILAPIKGHEFRRACNRIGGSFIRIAPGSQHCINVMEIRPTLSPEMELIDEADYMEDESLLMQKIQQLMLFFSLLVPDMTNEEEQILDDALIKTYAEFGITEDNASLYEDIGNPKMKRMPVLGDLQRNLLKEPLAKRLAVVLSKFVTGSAQSFNRQTNVDLSNKYIVLDLSELKGKLLPIGMMIALDFVWDKIKSDRTQKKAVMIDEIWQLIGASSNKLAAEFCLTIFKTIRGYGGAAISATQDLSDFFGLEEKVRKGDHQQQPEQNYSEPRTGRSKVCTGCAETDKDGTALHYKFRARRGARVCQQQ